LAAEAGLKASTAAAMLRRASTAEVILAVGIRAEAVIQVATPAANITIDRGGRSGQRLTSTPTNRGCPDIKISSLSYPG